MPYDVQALESQIRTILSAPGVDLSTISAKRVRKQLMEDDPELTVEVVRKNKEEIDGVISQVYEEISGAGQDDDEEEEEESVKSNKRKKKGGDDEDGAPRPAKKKAKNGQEKSDEKLARKLSNEINGRATRGAAKNRSNGATKKARNKKSAATVGSDDDDDNNEGGGKKKRSGGGGGGGFKKEYILSEPLSALLQVEKLSRPQVVKGIWDYIKGNSLQNPNNKREIICDGGMKAVFNVEKIDMFQMNKVLGQHLHESES